ncbi:MAG: putative Ig domain-containing protein, partial [Verrucomicrobiota bacterium]
FFNGLVAGGEQVANAGLFRKTAGAGGTAIGIAFSNTGTVEVRSGSLNFYGGGEHTGDFTVAAGANLNLGGGVHNLADVTITGAGTFSVGGGTANFTGTLDGSGTLSVSGGTANFNVSGAITLAGLTIRAGILGGSNDFAVNGVMNFAGGEITGSGSITANGGLVLSSADSKVLTGRTLVNAAAATWSGGGIYLASGAVLSNAATGTFDCEYDGGMIFGGGSAPAVANAGLFRKSAGAGGTAIGIAFNNTGTVEVRSGSLDFNGGFVQTAGLTLLEGGDLSGFQPFQFLGGVLAGNGTVFGSVTNNGVVSPGASPGRLIIRDDYTQTANGALNIELAGVSPGVTFDQLIVSNAVTLAGALNVTLPNGFYPAPDFIFTNVIRAASSAGAFSTFNYPTNIIGLQINYGVTNVDIEVINTLPNLPALSDRTMDELTLLSFNVGATDADSPTQTVAYHLTNSPAGASIDSSGLLTWTPTETQGPGTNEIIVVVTDNGAPNLTVTQSFQVVVNEINVAPTLTLPANQTIPELTTLNVSASATDTDKPANPLTFGLISPPDGMTINVNNGAISWTPTEAQGSNTYTISVFVADTNATAINAKELGLTNTFTVIVNEVNVAPVLTVPSNATSHAGVIYSNNAIAKDVDLPANALTFSLVSGPAGLTTSSSGQIVWPTANAAPGDYAVDIRVFDNGIPSLGATQSFTLTVVAAPFLTIQNAANTNTLTWTTVDGTSYRVQFKDDLTMDEWNDLAGDTAATGATASVGDGSLSANINRFYRIRVLP